MKLIDNNGKILNIPLPHQIYAVAKYLKTGQENYKIKFRQFSIKKINDQLSLIRDNGLSYTIIEYDELMNIDDIALMFMYIYCLYQPYCEYDYHQYLDYMKTFITTNKVTTNCYGYGYTFEKIDDNKCKVIKHINGTRIWETLPETILIGIIEIQ